MLTTGSSTSGCQLEPDLSGVPATWHGRIILALRIIFFFLISHSASLVNHQLCNLTLLAFYLANFTLTDVLALEQYELDIAEILLDIILAVILFLLLLLLLLGLLELLQRLLQFVLVVELQPAV